MGPHDAPDALPLRALQPVVVDAAGKTVPRGVPAFPARGVRTAASDRASSVRTSLPWTFEEGEAHRAPRRG